jgi:TPR repeat protein
MQPGSESAYRPATQLAPAEAAITRLAKALRPEPAPKGLGGVGRLTRSATRSAVARLTRATTRLAPTEIEELGLRARRGDADAQAELGLRLLSGLGAGKDKSEGLRWSRLAADQGHAHGMFQLGSCYYNGDGVTRDLVRAYMCFSLAAARGVPEAKRIRDLLAPHLDAHQHQVARVGIKQFQGQQRR